MRQTEARSAARARYRPIKLRTSLHENDAALVRRMTQATGFFSQSEIEVAVELVEVARSEGAASGYLFLFAETDGTSCGYTCFGSVPCTAHSFDLYWIVVDSNFQGQGIGKQLLMRTERIISKAGGRGVYAETSSRAQYRPTRSFYRHTGFAQVARLKDFYAPGDSKIIYCKAPL